MHNNCIIVDLTALAHGARARHFGCHSFTHSFYCRDGRPILFFQSVTYVRVLVPGLCTRSSGLSVQCLDCRRVHALLTLTLTQLMRRSVDSSDRTLDNNLHFSIISFEQENCLLLVNFLAKQSLQCFNHYQYTIDYSSSRHDSVFWADLDMEGVAPQDQFHINNQTNKFIVTYMG